jgi:sugar lactone lactonase YvrE
MPAVRLAVLMLSCVLLLGAGGAAPRVTLAAPAAVTAGVPWSTVVRVSPAPRGASVSVSATAPGERRIFAARGSKGTYRARIVLTSAGRWALTARVGRQAWATRQVSVAAPTVRHPYAVVVDPRHRVYVADGDARRILRLDSATRRLWVHATGLDEPTGLAAAADRLYVADFNAGLVRRIGTDGRVTTLTTLPQVTAVAATKAGDVYAVTLTGTLARISPSGRTTRIAVPGGLDRPHGIALDGDGQLLVAEDSRRVRRVDPTTGHAELVVDGVDTNKLAVADDGTLFLAGATRTGGTLRRLTPAGRMTTLLDDLRVSDVAILPDGSLVATTVGPGAVYRVHADTGTRTKLAG